MMAVVQHKKTNCPVCNVEIGWDQLPLPNTYRGKCPNCGMGFTSMNGSIISDPKFSKK